MKAVAAARESQALTTSRKIFRAATSVAIFTTFAKIGSMAKELAVARWFGRSDALDAFLIAFLLPSFVVNLVAGSFNAAVIPTFIQVRETEGHEVAQRLFSAVIVWSLALLASLSIILGLFAPYYLPLLGSGFASTKLMLTRKLLYVLLPFVMLSGLGLILGGILNAFERFALPAITPILTPIVIIALLIGLVRVWGVFALAVGTVIGVFIEAILLARALKSIGISMKPRWHGMSPHLRYVAKQYVPLVAAAFLAGSTVLVDQSMAAILAPGSVAALSYGNKVVSLVLGIGSTALGTAVLPYFSQLTARRDWAGCGHSLKVYCRLIIFASLPVTVGLFVFSQPLIRVLFQRGAFTAVDTSIVSRVQAFLALQIPFYLLGIMGVRMISALKRNAPLVFTAVLILILDVIFNYIFMKYLGVAGIALSTALVCFLNCAAIYLLIFTSLSPAFRRRCVNGNSSL